MSHPELPQPSTAPARILLVDDDPQSLGSTRKILEFSGHEVVVAVDGQAALEHMRANANRKFDVVVSDVRMPRLGGLEFLRALSLCGETTPVILMTAFGRVEEAVWAMKFGAVDFLTKPFKRQQLLVAVEMATKRARAQAPAKTSGAQPPHALDHALRPDDLAGTLIGHSSAIRLLREMVIQVGATAATVLLAGESGTGKELVARCLHRLSVRRQGQFVALNCAAVPETLIESELFGYEKGAFTGAGATKPGLFEAADRGTLLLDEIGDMPLSLQATLLRTLQEGEVRRIGSTVSKKVDVRLIAATHRDLRERSKQGTFRHDLMYRLEVVTIELPPLRARLEDVSALSTHFLGLSAARHGKKVESLSQGTLAALEAHAWPGNIRELANVIERAVVFARGSEITPDELPPHMRVHAPGRLAAPLPAAPAVASGTVAVPLGTSLREVEDLLIRKTLEATDGDKNMTAKLLGINSRTIYRKLDRKTEE